MLFCKVAARARSMAWKQTDSLVPLLLCKLFLSTAFETSLAAIPYHVFNTKRYSGDGEVMYGKWFTAII